MAHMMTPLEKWLQMSTSYKYSKVAPLIKVEFSSLITHQRLSSIELNYPRLMNFFVSQY